MNRVMTKVFDENKLKELTVKELRELAKENNSIKVPCKSKKAQIIETLMHP